MELSVVDRAKIVSRVESQRTLFESLRSIVFGSALFYIGYHKFNTPESEIYEVNKLSGAIFELYGGLNFLGGVLGVFLGVPDIKQGYEKIIELPLGEREKKAETYLKEMAERRRRLDQHDDIWNFFGLLPRSKSETEKQYEEYLIEKSGREKNQKSPAKRETITIKIKD